MTFLLLGIVIGVLAWPVSGLYLAFVEARRQRKLRACRKAKELADYRSSL